MAQGTSKLISSLGAVDRALGTLRDGTYGTVVAAVDRWRSDAEAIQFHLRPNARPGPTLVAIIGGTGTGKSTVLNRLLGARLSATSFRRTFTSGAIAIASDPADVPQNWLAVEHRAVSPAEIPARGQADALAVVKEDRELTRRITLIDTPDLDGDQPLHHTQADRVFRWAQSLIFLVTPEKYQMTELLPYYRLAHRYGIPAIFVMNKAEETEVVEDYRQQLGERDWTDAAVFAIPRDDAAWEPPAQNNLDALRQAISQLQAPQNGRWRSGLRRRIADLLDRLQDQVVAPLREDRRQVDQLMAALRALEAPAVGVDVNPLSEALNRRLQQRSVLYLMGPQRVLERVRQVPGMILRLPKTIWDVVVRGRRATLKEPEARQPLSEDDKVPDFATTLFDQFVIVQSRIDDVLRSTPAGQRWLEGREASYRGARMDPELARQAAREEIAELEKWLDTRWNATPRDTILLMRILKLLPGGERLSRWAETAPYLLALIVASHHAIFGPIDLALLGGFSLVTWVGEKLSNEVAQRVRETNRKMAERFAALAHQQIEQISNWLDQQAPAEAHIASLEKAAEQLGRAVEDPSKPD